MDHMRISGTEPLSVILGSESVKISLSQKGWCNKPTKITFSIYFNTENLMLSNATNRPKSTVELGYMCPRGLSGPPSVTFTK